MSSATLLLRQAVGYALRSACDVTPALLRRPTPCRDWDLAMLLRHASESLAALQDGAVTGQVGLTAAPPDREDAADPARLFRDRADRLIAGQATAACGRRVDIGGLPLPAITVECAGAIEIAVHGWDISAACGRCAPIPDTLAVSLLAIVPLLVPAAGRPPLFSPPVRTEAGASAGDRLVAFLGREPPSSPASLAASRAAAPHPAAPRPACASPSAASWAGRSASVRSRRPAGMS